MFLLWGILAAYFAIRAARSARDQPRTSLEPAVCLFLFLLFLSLTMSTTE